MSSFASRVVRPVINVAWLVCAALALLIFLAAIPLGYAPLFSGTRVGPSIDAPAWYIAVLNLVNGIISILAALVSLVLAVILFWKKRQEPMALFVSFFLLAYGVGMSGPLEALNGFRAYYLGVAAESGLVISPAVIYDFQTLLFVVPIPLLFYLFPNGRFIPRWTRYAALLLLLLAPVLIHIFTSQWLFAMTPLAWLLVSIAVLPVCMGFYAQTYRYRRVASPVERQQTKWVVFGLLLTFAILGFLQIPYAVLQQIPTGIALPWWEPLSEMGWGLSIIILPLALAVAVMRYRLWDIDIIINRTLVYGTLSAGVVVTYILIVALLGALLNTNVNLAAVIVTVTLTALFFQPLRARLQRAVNRAQFGAHDVPSPNHDIESQRASESPSRRRWLVLAHAAWLICAALALVTLLAAIPLGYAPYVGKVTVSYVAVLYFVSAAVSFLVALGSIVLAALLFWKKRDETMALFASFYILSYAIFAAGPSDLLHDFFRTQMYFAVIPHIGSALYGVLPILFLYLFPNGRFVPRWTRWAAVLLLLFTLPIVFTDWDTSTDLNPRIILILAISLGLTGAGLYAQIYRYRRAATLVERQQIKWGGIGVSLFVFFLIVSGILWVSLDIGNDVAQPTSLWPPLGDALWWLLMSIPAVVLTVAVMRYRLWDIDLIIHRALVYGAMTAGIIALYIVLVGALGALSQTSGNLLISLLATGLIAFLFQPLRERLQRGINHLMYGERDDPYAVLSKLGQHLESTLVPDAVLPTIVETVRAALKLPYTALALMEQDEFHTVAQAGALERSMLLTTLPLVYQAELVGQLILAPRARGEAFTTADLRLLRDIANQAGVAIHNVQLTADLQRSRERLVTAREEERRRLRRNLHDGLGPALASITLKLDAARNLLKDDADATDQLLGELKTQAQSAITDIRRLVYDLRPPALDELGLVSALREQVARYAGVNGLDIMFDAPESLPPLSAAVEVAAYRIATEALMNVVRHAHAMHCILRITCEKELRIQVEDDGVGLASGSRAGVGLTSMRERAAELGGTCLVENSPGGGTRAVARIPVEGSGLKVEG